MVNKIGLLCWIEPFPFFAKTRTQCFQKKVCPFDRTGKVRRKISGFSSEQGSFFFLVWILNQPFSFFLFATLGWPSIACVAVKVPINIFSSSEFLKQRGRRKKTFSSGENSFPGDKGDEFRRRSFSSFLERVCGKRNKENLSSPVGQEISVSPTFEGEMLQNYSTDGCREDMFSFFLVGSSN